MGINTLTDDVKRMTKSPVANTLSDVRVHQTIGQPPAVGANAYAQGTNIHVGGQEQHLPHELGHVAQQKQGRVKPSRQM